jgi:arylsulfatase A-like enzyme
MRCINLRSVLLVLTLCPIAGAMPAVWPEAEEKLAAWRSVADSVPRHPHSHAALEALLEQVPGESRDMKLLTLARSLPDEGMGIFALDAAIAASAPEARRAALEQVIESAPDSRIAARAVDLLVSLAPEETVAICTRVIAFGAGKSTTLARLRLAGALAQQGDFASAFAQQLRAFGDALGTHVPAAGIMYPALRRYQQASTLQHLQADWDALAVQDAAAERELAYRLAALVEQTQDPSTPEHALWKASDDIVVLEQLAASESAAPEFAARAGLQLARVHLREEDYDAYQRVVTDLERRLRSLSGNPDALMVLALGWQRLAHDARAVTPDAASRALMEEHARSAAALAMELAAGAEPGQRSLMLMMAADAFRTQERWDAEVVALENLLPLVTQPDMRERLLMRIATQHLFHTRRHDRIAAVESELADLTTNPELAERARQVAITSLYLIEDYAAALEALNNARRTATDSTHDALTLLEALIAFREGRLEVSAGIVADRLKAPPAPKNEAQYRALQAYLRARMGEERDAVSEYAAVVASFPEHKVTPALKFLLRGVRPQTSAPQPAPSGDAPNVLLLSIDTVRADHLGCYGYGRNTTPVMDSLAQGGVVFEQAYSTSSWTKPAHASVFTGLYPQVHGANGHDDMLLDAFPSLPELCAQSGYATLGVVSAPPLNRLFGFARGFQRYDDYTWILDREANLFLRNDGRQLAIHSGHTSSLITDTAIAMMERRETGERPFFLFVNYFDAHHNYQPPWPHGKEWRHGYFGTQFGEIDRWNGVEQRIEDDADVVDAPRLRDLYDAELRYVDEQVGRLLDTLRARGQLDNTIIVLFSDHGDEFMEHDKLAHGKTLFNEVTHVPLIIAGAGVPAGLRVQEPVSLVDVLPTLSALTGLALPEYTAGVPLLQPGVLAEIPDRAIFAGLDLPPYRVNSILAADMKLLRNYQPAGQTLFNLMEDPQEQDDATAFEPQIARELGRQLEDFAAESQAERMRRTGGASTKTSAAPESIEEMERQLRALGYL